MIMIRQKVLRVLSALSLMLMMAANCNPDPEPEPTPPAPEPSISLSIPATGPVSQTTDGNAAAEFTDGGGTANVSFTTTVPWTASSNGTWCTVSPTSGAAGSGSVTLTIASNDTYEERNAVVTLQAGTAKKTIAVKQLSATAMTVSPRSIDVPFGGGDYEIEVRHNVAFTVSVNESGKGWIAVKGTKALTTDKVGITVSPNEGAASREGVLTFKSSVGEVTVTVTQAFDDSFSLSPTEAEIPAKGGEFQVKVVTHRSYHLNSKPDWVSEKSAKDQVHTFTVSENPSTEERSGVLVFCDDSGVCLPFSVKQAGASAWIAVSPDSLEFDNKGGKGTVKVTSNTAWTVSSDASWCKVSPEKGEGEGSLAIEVEANASDTQRTAKVTVTDGAQVVKTVAVKQTGASLTVDPAELSFDQTGGKKSVTVRSNVGWKASSSATWCKVSPAEGSGDGTLTVQAEPNTTTDERTATLSITDGNQIVRTVTVKQTGEEPRLTVEPATLDFGNKGGKSSVKVTSNASWKAESDAFWCSVSPTEGKGDKSLTIEVEANSSTEQRTAVITVSCGSQVVRKIEVAQAGADLFKITPSRVTVSGDGGSFEITVSATQDYEVVSMPEWISQSGIAGKVHTFDVDANPSLTERSGKIVFTDARGVSLSCSVKQEGKQAFVRFAVDQIACEQDGGVTSVELSSNVKWTVESDASWCSVSPTGGEGNGYLTIDVDENKTPGQRSAKIQARGEGGCTSELVVKQEGIDLFEITPQSTDVAAAGGTFTVTVKATKSYAIESKPAWVNEVGVADAGSFEKVHTFSANQNTDTQERSGTIVFKDARGERATFTIRQSPAPYLSIVTKELAFGLSGSTANVSISSNTSWTAVSSASWCQVSPTEGQGNGNLLVTVGAYDQQGKRNATITVSATGGLKHTISVEQEGLVAFAVNPSKVDVDPDGGTFEVRVSSSYDYHINSKPEWIQEITEVPGQKIHKFQVGPAVSPEARSGVIVFCDDLGTCLPVNVRQEGKPDAIDWNRAFQHRSLFMRFTATWCGWCPRMARSVALAQAQNPGKIELVNLHAPSSNLGFAPTETLAQLYEVDGYPSGMMDGRRHVGNSSVDNTVQAIGECLNETEQNYPVSSAIGFASSFDGRKLDIDLNLYIKEADNYKVTVILTESGIIGFQKDNEYGDKQDYHHDDIARVAVTDITGDAFTVTTNRKLEKMHYSTTVPAGYNKNNLKILVIVQRAFGSKPRIVDEGSHYGDYYVDNCASGKAGSTLIPAFAGDANGGNEDIINGDPINW